MCILNLITKLISFQSFIISIPLIIFINAPRSTYKLSLLANNIIKLYFQDPRLNNETDIIYCSIFSYDSKSTLLWHIFPQALCKNASHKIYNIYIAQKCVISVVTFWIVTPCRPVGGYGITTQNTTTNIFTTVVTSNLLCNNLFPFHKNHFQKLFHM
jgi:hypothetical protein